MRSKENREERTDVLDAVTDECQFITEWKAGESSGAGSLYCADE